QNNEGLILIQYQHQQKCCWFTTKIKIKPECWNGVKQSIDKTKGFPNNKVNAELLTALDRESKLSNALIDTIKSRVSSIARDFQIKEIEPEAPLVKTEYERKFNHSEAAAKVEVNFFQLFDKWIESQKSLKSVGTVKHYRTTYNNLLSFEKVKKEKITLENINTKLYEKLVKYFMEDHEVSEGDKGMNNNTIGSHIKTLKVFLKYLKKEELLHSDISDFKVFKETSDIIFLTHEELDKLYNYRFENEALPLYRDLFLLMCYTSLRVSDLHRLGKQSIQDNVIRMRAHKTKRNITIPLLPISKAILEKYNYELPKFSDQKLNEHIKTICKLAGIDNEIELQESKGGKKVYNTYKKWELISSHIGGKTFISLMLQSGMQVKEVAEIVGKSTKVLEAHYHGLDNVIVLNKAQNAFNGK
ncbi:MAG TPA: site-specific integrase, partial [Cytophagaceae bacterium]|nr:site-specific integrase [Cytophagaceae bacterium]